MLVCREKGKMEPSDLAIEAWLAEFRFYSKLHSWFLAVLLLLTSLLGKSLLKHCWWCWNQKK